MFNLSDKDYRITEHVQAEMRRQAADTRLVAQDAADSGADSGLIVHRPRLIKVLAVLIVLLVIFAGVGQAFAQGPQPVTPDAGGSPEPFAEAMRAYREGLYALKHGDSQLAVERLTAAIEGIPTEVSAVVPTYQDMYWTLGEAQEAAGLAEEALSSYQHWLTLVGDEAAAWTVVKVQNLESQLKAVLVAELLAEQAFRLDFHPGYSAISQSSTW